MANEKAEPLKPQAMLAQADKFLRELYPRLGSNNNLLSPILADFGNYLLASHASSGSPLADLRKLAERIAHHPMLCNQYYSEKWRTDKTEEILCEVLESGSVASQEAAQPIPSIADVSDHNPNDPSCKACGSAMGWKCLSCGSTLEPTQEAAQPFPIDKTDDWEERQDRARQEAAQPTKEHLTGLFNLYTKANRGLIFSKRMRVVKAMEAAMLDAEVSLIREVDEAGTSAKE